MNSSPESSSSDAPRSSKASLPLKRRVLYLSLIYLSFLLVLAAIELSTRMLLKHVSSLELFVATPQQKAQVANQQQSTIFEGDPLLLWRLKSNLDHAVWDFTVLSTNSQHLRADYDFGTKQPGTIRIVCLGDSVTFGYRVPVIWPDKPTEYDPEWLPFPMLLEKQLRAANPGRTIEVVTMAVPGYTSHQGLAWLRRDIDKLQPDLLTVSYGWNDASLSDVPDRKAIRTDWYVIAVRGLVNSSQAFAHATRWLRSRQEVNPVRGFRPAARVSEREYYGNMLGITQLAQERGSRVIVIAAPYRDRETNVPEAEVMARYRTGLRSVMQERGLPFLEVRELTEDASSSNQGWFDELIHPNHMGHRLLASELLKMISARRMLTELNIPALTP